MESKKTLYIGAHPDDVFIAAGISIIRNPENSFVLTLTDGANLHESFPLSHGGIEFKDRQGYGNTRVDEDKKALSLLGLDVSNNYFNLRILDLKTYRKIVYINEVIKSIIKRKNIERLVTHEFPQAHPDHEIACFCTHHVARGLAMDVYEYPMYVFDRNGKELIREFVSQRSNVEIHTPDEEESGLWEQARKLYQTQRSITPIFVGYEERFAQVNRTFLNDDVTGTRYLFGKEKDYPAPEEVRALIKQFVLDSNPKPI